MTTGIEAQPDSRSCGPTCLHALYRHFGDDITLAEVIDTIERLDSGGTLEVFLANHALTRGYRATLYTYNLTVFDPTWFRHGVDLSEKLAMQARAKRSPKLRLATRAYLAFLAMGGRIRFEDLTRGLLRRLLAGGDPVLAGLSATYLYRAMREWGPHDLDDDIRGQPVGHFVLLNDYDRRRREIGVADPMHNNPHGRQLYPIHIDRVIGAVLLGALSFDANFLIIRPGEGQGA